LVSDVPTCGGDHTTNEFLRRFRPFDLEIRSGGANFCRAAADTALCRFRPEYTEADVAAWLEHMWADRVRYPFWEAHTQRGPSD
jgi:hypothetical protein